MQTKHPLDVTGYHCKASGIREGEDGSTHHIVAEEKDGLVKTFCRHCNKTWASLDEKIRKTVTQKTYGKGKKPGEATTWKTSTTTTDSTPQ